MKHQHVSTVSILASNACDACHTVGARTTDFVYTAFARR